MRNAASFAMGSKRTFDENAEVAILAAVRNRIAVPYGLIRAILPKKAREEWEG